jgi:hypothetical protein
MIEAGKPGQILWGDGNWIFLDIGFSGASGARGKTERSAFGSQGQDAR